MHWNEKIDLIKKEFSDEEFSVPHADRKRILRKIESRFISRSEDYYNSNDYSERFSNWWKNTKHLIETNIDSDLPTFLKSVINPNNQFWIAGESVEGIMIYKAKLNAILKLISIGQTSVQIFHIIQLKYNFLISFKTEGTETRIKALGDKELSEKLKRFTMSRSHYSDSE